MRGPKDTFSPSPVTSKGSPVALAQGYGEPKCLSETGASARNSVHANSLYRKSIKPLIEKRRRARINASLEQLRKLLQQTPDQQNPRALSRLEKAEILEMTVQQLHKLKKQGAVAASPSQDSQDFAAGYRHCINSVCAFLNSAGSSLSQDLKYKILQQLEETPGARPSMTSTPVSKVWQHHKTDTLSSSQPLLPWVALHPPQPPTYPLSDSHPLTSGSCSHPSATSTVLPQVPVSWAQPTSSVTTRYIRIWRPW